MNLNRNFGHLGKKQRAIIDDLLNGLNKHESLAKNKVRPARYQQWLKSNLFRRELIDRIDSKKRQGKFLMLDCFPQAASLFAKLLKSENEEIVRKTCIDVISLQKTEIDKESSQNDRNENQSMKIPDDKAARMLAILAEDEKPAPSEPEKTSNSL